MTGSGDMPPPPSYEEATKNLPPSAYPLGHQQPYHGQPAYDGHAQYPTYASGDQPPYPSGGQPSYPSGVQPPYASEGGQPPYASENQPLYPSGGQPYYPSGRQPLYPNRNQPMYPSGHPQYPSAAQGTYPYQPPPIQYSSRQPDQNTQAADYESSPEFKFNQVLTCVGCFIFVIIILVVLFKSAVS